MGLWLSKAEVELCRREARDLYARLEALMAEFVERHCERNPVASTPWPLMKAAWDRFVDQRGLTDQRLRYEDGLKYYNDYRPVRFPSPPYEHPPCEGRVVLGIRLTSMPGLEAP